LPGVAADGQPYLTMQIHWMLAMRFLREGRFQTFLIILGVTAGVAVVFTITELIGGLQSNLIARVLGVQAHAVVRPLEEDTRLVRDRTANADAIAARIEKRSQRLRSIDQWEQLLPMIEATPGVTAASPMASGAGFATRGAASKSIVLLGVDPERYLRVIRLEGYIVAGRFRVGTNEAVIGAELARDLGVAVGDRIRITSTENRNDTVTIAGLFDVGSRDLNRRWVFTSLRLAQSLLDLPGGITSIDLTVNEIFAAESIARRLAAASGQTVESWMTTNAQVLAAFENQNMTTRVIRTFVVIIVALGIASVLVVSVVQKQKEIGILRAMGATRRAVLAVFLMQGAIVGMFGAIAGSGLAVLVCSVLSRVLRNADGSPLFTPEFATSTFVSAIGMALAVGLVAAVAPARRAARLDPVAAIRG